MENGVYNMFHFFFLTSRRGKMEKIEKNVKDIIQEFKRGDKEKFLLIVDRMTPLINKYVRLLYKDEREDMHSELVLCLLESVNTIKYYNEEGQCIYFFSKALKNKFLELYKKSKLYFDSETVIEDEFFTNINIEQSEYEDCVINEDLKEMLSKTEGKKHNILYDIVFYDRSDAIMAEEYLVSRQYVNRVRRKFYNLLRDQYFK
jgi:hypothetical protein